MEKQGKYIDEIFHFTGKWEMPSLCGLMIRKAEERHLVIFTELYEENPGSSVTGMIETLAAEIIKKYTLEPAKAVFIVRNPERSAHYEFFAETFHLAAMTWDREKYTGLNWEKLEGFNFEM